MCNSFLFIRPKEKKTHVIKTGFKAICFIPNFCYDKKCEKRQMTKKII